MEIVKKFFNRETILYLFYGICTTIINYFTFALCYKYFFQGYPLISNTIAFISATIFAYITNKIFVFKSYLWTLKILLPEFFSFASARILSFIFEQLGLYLCIKYLFIENFIILNMDCVMVFKIILSFIVVILNYFVSKFIIFK